MKPNNEDVLHQDLNREEKNTGVYMMHLLFKEKGILPDPEIIFEKVKRRFECIRQNSPPVFLTRIGIKI